jgi:hypothetical protein
MNRSLLITLCTVFFMTMTLQGSASEEPFAIKTKTYSKSYPLSSNEQVTLDNQFGEMKINTWDKNEIKVDVNIEARANTDELAQKIIDNIYIQDSKSGSGVSFVTKMKNQKNNWNNDNKKGYKETGMKIDYVVYMPSGNPLTATNQFGAMFVPDFRGPVNLTSKFGSLTAGKLSNVKQINMEFGEARIESASGGKITLKFGKGDIRQVSGNVETRIEFCDKVRVNVDNNSKDLNIRSSYSNLYLNTSTNLSSSIDIKTSFGEFTNKTGFNVKKQGDDNEKSYGPKFDKQFNGTAGSGSNRIKVNSDFGEVIMGHNLEVDFSSDKKKKTKVI